MKKLLLLLFAVAAYAQGPKIPVSGPGIGPENPSCSFASQTSCTVTHNLNTLNIVVQCRAGVNGDGANIAVTGFSSQTVNSVTPTFSSSTGKCFVNGTGGIGQTGAAGATGATGSTGAAGAAATVAAGTTTTLSPGSPATFANVGTPAAAVFNVGIPQGVAGAAGATGSTGATGAAGTNGTNGTNDAAGTNGADALTRSFTFTAQSTRTITYSAGTYSDVGGTHDLTGPFRVSCVDAAGDYVSIPSSVSGTTVTITPGVSFTGTCSITGAGTGTGTGGASDFSGLTGTATDAQIPDNITINLAATATALAADPADCTTTGAAAHGVNAAGVATGCIDLVATYQPLDADLTSLAALASTPGMLKRTGAGAFGLAAAGTDYVAPAGNVATATALAANGTNCSAGNHPLGIDASGNAESCTADAAGSGIAVMTTGSADPSASCTAPSTSNIALYTQTTTQDVWMCVATNTWKKILSTTNTGTYVATGTTGTAPSTPSTGDLACYYDSTSKTQICKDDAGAFSTTVRGLTALSDNWVRYIGADGVQVRSQPASTNLSDASILVKNNQTNTFGAFKQTFTPSASVAGAQLTCAALPSSPANGDIACDSGDSNKVKVRSNGAWVEAGGGSGSGTVSSASVGQFAKYTGSTTVGGVAIATSDLPGEYICTPTTASGTTYACNSTNAVTSYVTGELYTFIADVANTGAVTMNFNSVGAKSVSKVQGGVSTALVANDIRAGQVVVTRYDGTRLQMVSQLGNAASGSGDALVANPLSQFAATTSLQLAGVISNETGSGALVFGTSPVLTTPDLGTPSAVNLSNATSLADAALSSKYKVWSCQPGIGDGLNAIPAGTYLQTICLNDTGATVTLSALKCFTDNSGSSTMNVTNSAGTGLLTGALTCTTSFASGTQSGTTTLANGDYLKFTFVADGTSKQSTWAITGSR